MPTDPQSRQQNRPASDGESLALSDEVVLDGIRKGSEEAILILYDRYASLILSLATHVLNDFALAEEVVQDVFLNLWKNPGSFNSDRGSFRGWLSTIARHRAIDYLRRRRDEIEIQEADVSANESQTRATEYSEMLSKVKRALLDMPATQREVFDMAYFQGMTHVEISDKTGAPLGTIKSRIRLALGSVRKLLGTPGCSCKRKIEPKQLGT